MTTVVTVIDATHVQSAFPRVLGVIGAFVALAAVAAAPAPPVRADMMGNAFLMALTNAGVSTPEPDSATALGRSVCPMLVAPGGSFDSVAANLVENDGMSYHAAGVFAIVAIATYCPAVLAPLMPHRLAS